MNVRNIRHPFTRVGLVDKYKKVSSVFQSCENANQQLTTLKWALRVGLDIDLIFDLLGAYQWKLIKQSIADELDQKAEKLKQEIEKLKDQSTPAVP